MASTSRVRPWSESHRTEAVFSARSIRPASVLEATMTWRSSADWANSRVSLGGVISANKGLDPKNAKSPILQQAIGILQDENTTFRFDASDLMPGAVGSGTFFKGIVAWVNGDDLDTVLDQIEAGWPSE